MTDNDLLANQFEEHRSHLRAVAYRILGSAGDADDTVQDAWLRLTRSDPDSVDNLIGWLTTVVSRIALDKLRARKRTREISADTLTPGEAISETPGPEDDALLADAIGPALMMVLDSLQPSERVAFVLHDTFGIPFADIGAVLGRSANAAKQLASRARHKVRGSDPADRDPARQRAIVDAFLDAARNGNFEALLAVLDPGVVLQADPTAITMGAPAEVRGADDVAAMFSGRAQGAQTVLVDGTAGAAWIVAGSTRVIWDITIVAGRIAHIDMLADNALLAEVDLT